MTITIHEERGVVTVAEIDLPARKVTSLTIDDERTDATFVGLSVLSGCVEAILRDEFERRQKKA
jgi:hypothetical protein